MWLKVNVDKSKILVVKKDQKKNCEKVRVNVELMECVDKFKYLGVISEEGEGYMGNDEKVMEREHTI